VPDLKARYEDGGTLFGIRVHFEPNTEDPSRVFRSMAQLIEVFQSLDTDLARSISLRVRPVQILHDVESGSVTAWLRTAFEQVDDDALKNLDWKPLFGQYLVKAKHKLLEFLEKRDRVEGSEELEILEAELLELAQETEVLSFPSYAAVPRRALLSDLRALSDALRELTEQDHVVYMSPEGDTPLSSNFRMSLEDVEDLLTAETRTGQYELVLLVKKPDYLGTSMWEFRLDNHIVHARMLDANWLKDFHNREITIKPGDGLRARVEVELKRAVDGSMVAARYNILRVLEVVPDSESVPLSFLDDALPAKMDFPALPPPLEEGRGDESHGGGNDL